MEQWVSDNWFNIFTIFFGSGLWFAIFTSHKERKIKNEEIKVKKNANLLAITASHRELWTTYLHCGDLQRVLETAVNLENSPVTHKERVFVHLVLQHLNSVYYSMTDKLVLEYDGIRRDIEEFFALPIPKAIWRNAKSLQNHDFAAFIESALEKPINESGTPHKMKQ